MAVLFPLLIMANASAATTPVPQVVISTVEWDGNRGELLIEVRLLNVSEREQSASLPAAVTATLTQTVGGRALRAERAPGSPASVTVPAKGFTSIRYRVALQSGVGALDGALLEVPDWGARRITTLDHHVPATAADLSIHASPAPAPAPAPAFTPARSAASPTSAVAGANDFLPNLSAYEPIYAVYGPGTDSDARLQLSFRYQLFGKRAAADRRRSWAQGIYLAYTQRMFWDLGAESSPFHNIDFMPELFYSAPPISIGHSAALGGQAGFRHESNGRSGDGSRSLNTIYIQPQVTLPVGRYTLVAGPRFWAYAGSLSDNPDVRRYRGNSGFFAQIGEDGGVKLGLGGRMNFGSDKGALDGNVSYPIDRIISSNLNLYIFGQAFIGYGENLLDYNRRMTRVRVGFSIVR